MSELDDSLGEQARTSAITEPITAGLLMRNAREANGLDVSVLAAILKVPVNKIEALEANRFDALPDLVFARALASSVCRSLKIDSASVLALMPGSIAPTMKTDESGINTPFKAPGEASGLASWRQWSKPVVVSVVVLLAGTLILLLPALFPTTEDDNPVTSISDEALQSQPNVLLPADSAVLGGNTTSLPADLDASSASPLTLSAASDGSPTGTSATAVSEAFAPVVEGAGTSTGVLVLTAKETSWVQVVDAAGVVHLRKTLRAGDVVGISGVLPLAVVLGRADAVDVQIKGERFEVTTRTKENIARFEVR